MPVVSMAPAAIWPFCPTCGSVLALPLMGDITCGHCKAVADITSEQAVVYGLTLSCLGNYMHWKPHASALRGSVYFNAQLSLR